MLTEQDVINIRADHHSYYETMMEFCINAAEHFAIVHAGAGLSPSEILARLHKVTPSMSSCEIKEALKE